MKLQYICLFVLMPSARVKKKSVIGQFSVFQGTGMKHWIKCLAQGYNGVPSVSLESATVLIFIAKMGSKG